MLCNVEYNHIRVAHLGKLHANRQNTCTYVYMHVNKHFAETRIQTDSNDCALEVRQMNRYKHAHRQTYTHIHAYTHTYLYTHTHILYLLICLHAYIYTYIHSLAPEHTYTGVYVYKICTYTCIHVDMYICMYVYPFLQSLALFLCACLCPCILPASCHVRMLSLCTWVWQNKELNKFTRKRNAPS